MGAGAVGVWRWVVVECSRDAPAGASAVCRAVLYLSIYLASGVQACIMQAEIMARILPRTSPVASANKPPPGRTTCAGRPSFARGGGSRRQLDLSAHTWRWAHRGKKRREMPHVHQGSYGPPGADNMPRTAGAKRPTAAFARLRRERPQRRNRSARRCARRMRSSQSQSLCPTRSLTRALTGARCVSFAQLW